jgi:hypothetical protein
VSTPTIEKGFGLGAMLVELFARTAMQQRWHQIEQLVGSRLPVACAGDFYEQKEPDRADQALTDSHNSDGSR